MCGYSRDFGTPSGQLLCQGRSIVASPFMGCVSCERAKSYASTGPRNDYPSSPLLTSGGSVSQSAGVRVEASQAVATVSIDNPPLNLLTLAMVDELSRIVADLEKDDGVRSLVVVGAGTHFSGGMDMREWSRLGPKEVQEAVTRGSDSFLALEHLTKPTVAAITGICRGAGAELALACDIRIADESATFSHPEVDIAWMPSHGATARLPRLVGRAKALEILLSRRDVRALDALRLGLVDHLTSPGNAVDEAGNLAALFASKPRAAVKAIKRALTEGEEKPYRNRFLLESQHAVQLLWTDEFKAAVGRLRERKE